MAQDISNFIDPKLIEVITKLNEQIVLLGTNIDKYAIPAIKSLEAEQSKNSKTTADNTTKKQQLTEAQKQAAKIENELATSEAKLNALKEDSAKKTDQLTNKIIQNQLEYQKQKKVIADLVKVQNAAKGSTEQLSAVNVILEKRLKEVNQTTDEGKKKADLLRSAIDKNNTKIKEQSSALAAQKINIGNYRNSLEGLSVVVLNLTTQQRKLDLSTKSGQQQYKALQKEINTANNSITKYTGVTGGLIGKLDNLPGPIGNATSSIVGMGKAMWALVANPVGATIAAITAALALLYKAFTSTDSGANKLSGTFKAIGNVVDVLLDRTMSYYNMIWSLFTFDWEGVKKNGKDAFGGIGKQIAETAKAGYNYIQIMDDIDDREAASAITIANLEKEYKALYIASKNRALGAKEQLRLADLAMQKETEKNKLEVQFQLERTEATKNDLATKIQAGAMTIESRQKMLDKWLTMNQEEMKAEEAKNGLFAEFVNKNEADFQELQKMAAAKINTEQELNDKTARLQTSMFAFKKEIADEEKQLVEESKKRTTERTKAEKEASEKRIEFNNAILDGEEKRQEEELKLWAERINEKYELGLKEIEIEKGIKDSIAKLNQEYRDKEEEAAAKETDKLLADIEKIKDEREKNEEDFKQAAKQQAIELGNYLFDSKKNQLQREFEAAEGNAEKQKALSKKIAQAEKNQALFNIAMNTAVAITKVLGQTGIFGLAAWIPIAALGAVQAAMVQATPIPQFAKGTNFAPGGVSLVGEKGRELIQKRNGEIFLANNPALVNLERGSKVFNNQKTEAMLNDANIVSELRQTRKAIQRMPQPVFLNGSKIAERRGNYWSSYLKTKHRLN